MEKAKEICLAVKGYFAEKGIKINDVADMLGISRQAVTTQLGGRVFGRASAEKYATAFGFNANYLMTGEGSLLPVTDGDGRPPASLEVPAQVAEMLSRMSATIQSQQETIAILVRNGDATKKAGPRFPAKADPLIK